MVRKAPAPDRSNPAPSVRGLPPFASAPAMFTQAYGRMPQPIGAVSLVTLWRPKLLIARTGIENSQLTLGIACSELTDRNGLVALVNVTCQMNALQGGPRGVAYVVGKTSTDTRYQS
jgi:hypothetical protein